MNNKPNFYLSSEARTNFHLDYDINVQDDDELLVLTIKPLTESDHVDNNHIADTGKPTTANETTQSQLKTHETLNATSGRGLRIPIFIHDQSKPTSALIDSGATIDAISDNLFRTCKPIHTRPYYGLPIAVANRATIKPTIMALIKHKILGKWITNWYIVLHNLSHDIILGLPFQHRMGMIMDCKAKQIHFTRIKCSYYYSYQENTNAQIESDNIESIECLPNQYILMQTKKGITIKPRSRQVVRVQTTRPIKTVEDTEGIITGLWDLPRNLKVITGLTNLNYDKNNQYLGCDIVVINIGDKAYQAKKHEKLANFSLIAKEDQESLLSIVLEEESILTSKSHPTPISDKQENPHVDNAHCDIHDQLTPTQCLQCELEVNLITPQKEKHTTRTIDSLQDKPDNFDNIKLAIDKFRLCDTYLSDKEVYTWAEMLMDHYPVWDPNNINKPIKRTSRVECHIELDDDVPVERRYTTKDPVLHEIERKHIQKMYERNIIQPSKSNYAQPIILADKKNGSIRFCVDYRGINAKTKKFCYPLPRMDEILITLGNAKHFSLIDQSEAFWSIPLAEESRHKTAFISRSGLWEFLSMPFGLKNAPAMQQSLLDAILTGLSWQCCICYVDDIVIFSNSIPEHLSHVSEILSRLQENDLTITAAKADLCMPSFDILGYRASKDGIIPGEKHLLAIKDFPQPRTVKEVQSFLGLINFLRRFIPNCSQRQRALHNIITKTKRGKVTLEQQALAEFQDLKRALQSYPVLIHPNMYKPFYIHVDASGTGYGAILTQRTKDANNVTLTKSEIPKGITKDHQVIAYASIVLPKSHANYNNPEREASAMKWATEAFKHYIIGKQVIIFTDHQTFEYSISQRPAHNTTSKNQIIAKCAAAIQKFDPIILHRPGKSMVIPDTLSRIHKLDRIEKQQMNHVNAMTTRAQTRKTTTLRTNEAPSVPTQTPAKTPTNSTQGPPTPSTPTYTTQQANLNGNQAQRRGSNGTSQVSNTTRLPGELKRKRNQPIPSTLPPVEARYGDRLGNSRISDPSRHLLPNKVNPSQLSRSETPPLMDEYHGGLPERVVQKTNTTQLETSRDHQRPDPNTDRSNKKPKIEIQQQQKENDHLRQEQEKDPYCKTIRSCLSQGPIPNDNPDLIPILTHIKSFYYDNNQIIRRRNFNRSLETRHDPAVLPRSMIEQTIDKYHHPPISGHAKYDKLIDILEKRYWFENMREFTKTYVQSCHSCQISKPTVTWEGRAKPYQGQYPNDIVHLDFTKGTGVTTKGNTHILAIIDNFSNFVRLYPVSAVDAQSAAQCLIEYITTLSCPVRIVCDNGNEFRNALLDALTTALNITKVHISPYHSQANGKVENVHRNVKTMLRSYIHNYVNDWDMLLPMLQLAHNSHISKSTGYSPFYLMHGFPPILPTDTPDTQFPDYLTKDEYILRLQKNLANVFQFVRHYRALQMAKREEDMNERNKHKLTTLEKGQLVLMRSHALQKKFNKKLLPKAQGEFFIVEQGHGDHYELKDPHSLKLYPGRVHIGQLIKYSYRLSDSEKIRLGTDKVAVQHLPTNKRIVDEQDNNVYEVEQIRGSAIMEDGSIQYQVKWKGFPFRPKNSNSWVNEEDLYAPELLERYKKTPEFQRLMQGRTRVS